MNSFLHFALENGLIITRLVHYQIGRCPTVDHPNKNNGAFLYCGEWGWVQNHAIHTEIICWSDGIKRSQEEQEKLNKKMEKSKAFLATEIQLKHSEAAKKANLIINRCMVSKHAYLDKKGFPDIQGLVLTDDPENPLICVPMYDKNRKVVGIQMIDIYGQKKFLHGQQSKGSSFTIGQSGIHCWCEGYATGLSIFYAAQVLRIPVTVHVCFSDSNMVYLASGMTGIVFADNDESGAGLRAAEKIGLPYFMSEQAGEDFNDLYQKEKKLKASFAVREILTRRNHGKQN